MQGLNCAVEGVRLLNLTLKSTHDNLDRALQLYSEVNSRVISHYNCHALSEILGDLLRGRTKPSLV